MVMNGFRIYKILKRESIVFNRETKMIREFCVQDKEQLVKIVKQGIMIDEKDIVNYLTDENTKIIVYDDRGTGLLGFSSFRIWGKDKNKGEVDTYVAPASRRKGIGTLLYNEIMKYPDEVNLDFISTRFRADKDDATLHYRRLGYEKWYEELDLYYEGEEQPKSDLKFVSYEDIYFEQYAEGLRASFYELRKANDFKPYLCCELNKEKREELLKNRDDIFLLLNNGNLVASVKINDDGHLDDIFVVTAYQGKGYGKVIVQFAIDKAMQKGCTNIGLSAIGWNKRALNLYQSLGFRIVQATHYYRIFKA
jgi:ribosomal protein S18 acetylase RimI-like enzyme